MRAATVKVCCDLARSVPYYDLWKIVLLKWVPDLRSFKKKFICVEGVGEMEIEAPQHDGNIASTEESAGFTK